MSAADNFIPEGFTAAELAADKFTANDLIQPFVYRGENKCEPRANDHQQRLFIAAWRKILKKKDRPDLRMGWKCCACKQASLDTHRGTCNNHIREPYFDFKDKKIYHPSCNHEWCEECTELEIKLSVLHQANECHKTDLVVNEIVEKLPKGDGSSGFDHLRKVHAEKCVRCKDLIEHMETGAYQMDVPLHGSRFWNWV